MKRRAILFGAGTNGKSIISKLRCKEDLFTDDYISFADNAPEKIGTIYEELPVLDGKTLNNESADCIIVCPQHREEIIDQLTNEQNIDKWKVISFEEYERQCYAKKQYELCYSGDDNREEIFDTKKLVVYTAIMGLYDDLKDPLFVDKDITYVCFTNNREFRSEVWNVEYLNDEGIDNSHLARKIKFYPDTFFKDYETSVWVDGKYLLRNDIRSYILKYQKTSQMLCFPHFSRKCVYDEAIECILTQKASKEDAVEQISKYRMEGYPFDNGLFETGCIVRNHNDGLVKKIMDDWFEQINKFTIRDQISFPYVCWKNHYLPDISDLYIEDNMWLKKGEHKV